MIKSLPHTFGLMVLLFFLGLAWSVAAQSDNATSSSSEDSAVTNPSAPEPTDATENTDSTTFEQSAASSTSTNRGASNRIETINERQDRIEARRVEFQNNQAERRATLQERAQQRILNLAANVSNRMEAALRRLDNVAMRLDDRTAIIAEQGFSTGPAQAELATAYSELERARIALATIDADVIAFVSSENPRASWSQVRTTYATARDAIRAAHTSIRTSIRLLQTAQTAPPASEESAEAISPNE